MNTFYRSKLSIPKRVIISLKVENIFSTRSLEGHLQLPSWRPAYFPHYILWGNQLPNSGMAESQVAYQVHPGNQQSFNTRLSVGPLDESSIKYWWLYLSCLWGYWCMLRVDYEVNHCSCGRDHSMDPLVHNLDGLALLGGDTGRTTI